MVTFRPVTDRIHLMHEKTRNRLYIIDAERALITTEFYRTHKNMVPAIRRPMLLLEICKKMTIRVEDFEILVGNKCKNFCGCGSEPEWGRGTWVTHDVEESGWTLEADGLYHCPKSDDLPMAISPEDLEAFKSIEDFWKGNTYNDMAAQWVPEGYMEFAEAGVSAANPKVGLMMMPSGHLTPGFAKIINKGYGAIRREAQQWLDAHINNLMGEDAEKVMFYTAVTLVCDAATIYIRRYGDVCIQKSRSCDNPARKAELLSMADSLYWISENPCRSFRESLQAALLYQYLLHLSSLSQIGSFGRIDQYTWPFLKEDLRKGCLTMDQAQEILDCFYLKVNGMYGGGKGPLVKIVGIGNTYLHNTIGGVDPDSGEDASNPVTYMVLQSVSRLSLHDPTISLRINKDTPDDLWELAIETSRRVGGLPLFQNDDVIIPGIMRELGFTLHDARDYAIIGCQEITGSGNDYACAGSVCPPHASIHYSAVLSMALNDGKNPMNGHQSPIHTGYLYEMESFEQVQQAWCQLSEYYLRAQVSLNNYLEYLVQYNTPHAILSISLDGCMESGRDCTAGGAKYNSYGGTATGLATVADSLSTIKYMCYDNHFVDRKTMYDAVMANWKGYEELRQKVLHDAPHFGNADKNADAMMRWVLDQYYSFTKKCYSKRAKVFKAGLYSAADHVGQGYTTWATPDGRLAGTPIADAASPAQGRDVNGPTAVLASSLCYDQSRYMDGVCLNLRIHPSALSNAEGVSKLRDLVKVYMSNGGAEIQFNVVSSETMRKAQIHPEEFRDLVVRIAGYSAYFIELSDDCQNDLIHRTENNI